MSRVKTTVVRKSGGQVWEDPSLLEWDPNHFRLFVGNLGNDVTDDILRNAFVEYPSLAKTKVVRDREGKTRGFGFVSFQDPDHFLRAWREKNGKYIGSRPVKLSRANSDVTPADVSDKTLDSKVRNSLYSRTKHHGNRVIKKKKEKRSSKSSNQATAAAELMASSAAPITQTSSSTTNHHQNTHPSSRMEPYSKRN
ncbi:splicing factor, WW domain -binding Rbm42 [Schizosaccharomyces osmophilus]|uniref:Splicing factor, WW domain -binding Rbm42 n=1 Tax=Schizosaccharomyces osmophilus TaxID=2545709 RepID=A0AAF0AWG9_9SCHI|nr:splicing factor, WW domain -binding Rbm42 [Schizosaccharomyces osmophilus]WBW73637.1 splicing factor, WW domain -binding Rbm42 [Schizosaccharomyces osmophilus]